MQLINRTYFVNEIYIPSDILNENVDSYIIATQAEILTDLLGDDIYLSLKTQMDTETITDEFFTKLIDGEVYQIIKNDLPFNVNYIGLRQMLACFTFFNFAQNEKPNAVANEKVSENIKLISADLKLKSIRAYNKGVDLYKKSYEYLKWKIEKENLFATLDYTEKNDINPFGI